ncbi:MAG TPA: helicase C-terminal domain-containing protein [Ktedonobacteraceae bacterium]|nr:helicase C-terminal domain-containing protein [Ktedonobacteraceae bacterium]
MAEVELRQIGPYLITELLRTSSTGNYYRAKLRKKDILIKKLTISLSTPEEQEAFLNRAKQLKRLKNRNIVNVIDANFDGDSGYIAMEYVAGETMRQRFAAGQLVAPDEIRRYLSPLAEALHYAHVNHTPHGNLHPGNLLLAKYNDILLTEFALKLPGSDKVLDDEAQALPYMAPEHLRGEPTFASDQYALAVMVYEWLCGRRPYEATERAELLHQQEHDAFPQPHSLNEAISPAVERVVVQALKYNPDERFPHTQAFADNYLSALMGFEARPATPLGVRTIPTFPPLKDIDKADKVDQSMPAANNGKSVPQPPAPPQPLVPPTPVFSENGVEKHIVPEPLPPLPHWDEPPLPPTPLPASEKEPPVTPLAVTGFGESRLQTTVSTDLRQGGVLSHSLPGYEERPAQIEMAMLVARSITHAVPSIIEAGTGTGKALDVETPIATPTGWKRMGDLVVGDTVFDEKGQPTRVVTAFDVMYDRPCYEVEFSDGSILVADAEHEWVSYTAADRKWAGSPRKSLQKVKNFVTLEQIALLNELIELSLQDDTLSVEEAVSLVGGHHWTVYQTAREMKVIRTGKRARRYPRSVLLTTVRDRLTKDLNEQRRDGRSYTLVTTEQMAATLTIGSSARANHAIALANALVLPDADLPIAPYFLGVWLGDGSSRSNQITTADPDLITEIEKDGYSVRSLQSHPYLYAVDDENGKSVSRWQPGMTGRLRVLGLLQNKHVPMPYLRASEQQRRSLLAGLLDTDGTVNRCGAVEFMVTNQQLAQDVYELVCSLGFRPTLRQERATLNGKDCGPKWTIAFTTNEQVFRLKRKIAAHKERLRNYSPERNRFRYVVTVRKVPSRPVRCIQVDAPSHLYLAGRSMIPTHNSLAYLLPVVRSGKVAIVSTANKALQEQLFYKDIPFVQQHIKHFEAALVKGVNNYLCIDRMESERVGMQHYTRNREFKRLLDIVEDPDADFSGDFETLGFQLPSDIRGRVATDSDQCAWNKCSYFMDCYVRQMRERAEVAQVIVVNHTLLLLDAAIGGFLLPDRDVIILDEAHHLEEEATRSFTITISPAQIQTLLAQRMLKDHSLLSLQDEVLRTAQNMWIRLEQVANPGFKGRVNLEAPLEEGLRLATVISDLADSLRKQRPKNLEDKDSQLYDKLLKRTQNLSENVRVVFSAAQPDKFVYFVDRVESGSSRSGFALQASASPLDVTNWLKERLFDKCNVICTSATLATVSPGTPKTTERGANFNYFRRRIGLDPVERPDVLERVLPLAFDYESNALLYLPRDLPEPTFGSGSDEYMKAIAREMYKLVKLSRGRAFLLFSSKRMLDRAYELMSPHLNFPLLKQGDASRLELTRRFRQEEGAILFGLKSFWEGVDIAGEALSLVVIDKLPFDPPDDPVHEARVALMKAAGENWFGAYVLPQAVLRLKQGLGRLLRTRDDRGVMAILDTRLHTKGYGKLVINALPPARRTSSLQEVDRFFAQQLS